MGGCGGLRWRTPRADRVLSAKIHAGMMAVCVAVVVARVLVVAGRQAG